MKKIIAVANQKGGVGKTAVCLNLGAVLSSFGKKVLLIDLDPQGSLSAACGIEEPDGLENTLSEGLVAMGEDTAPAVDDAVIYNVNGEGFDLIPGNINLAALEAGLWTEISREYFLQKYINTVMGGNGKNYDYIIIDCCPSLGMLTINALTAAHSVLIPTQAEFLPVKGLQQLLSTINRVRQRLNPELEIEGIVFTMVDRRTTLAKEIMALVKETYGNDIRFFTSAVPMSAKAREATSNCKSILAYDAKGKAASAYKILAATVDGII